jgi:hypothetical protein
MMAVFLKRERQDLLNETKVARQLLFSSHIFSSCLSHLSSALLIRLSCKLWYKPERIVVVVVRCLEFQVHHVDRGNGRGDEDDLHR